MLLLVSLTQLLINLLIVLHCLPCRFIPQFHVFVVVVVVDVDIVAFVAVIVLVLVVVVL
mgnify:CR=1 FL=1